MVIKHHKVVSTLPSPLEANAIYYVRTGEGFDIRVVNSAGTIAYKENNLTSAEVLERLKNSTLTNIGTAEASDKLLIQDSSDGNTIKTLNYGDLPSGGGGGGIASVSEDPAPTLAADLNTDGNKLKNSGGHLLFDSSTDKVTFFGAEPIHAINVKASGLNARMNFQGGSNDNPGIQLQHNTTGTRRVLLRSAATGASGAELQFYTTPDGSSTEQIMIMKDDGTVDMKDNNLINANLEVAGFDSGTNASTSTFLKGNGKWEKVPHFFQITGRAYGYTDNRWVGSNNAIGSNHYNFNAGQGTGTTPNLSWLAKGLCLFPEGAKLKTLSMVYRYNSSEPTGMNVHLTAVGSEYDGVGWDSPAESAYAKEVVLNNYSLPFTAAARNDMQGAINIPLGDYEFPNDKLLHISFKPQGTLTGTRYFEFALYIKWEY